MRIYFFIYDRATYVYGYGVYEGLSKEEKLFDFFNIRNSDSYRIDMASFCWNSPFQSIAVHLPDRFYSSNHLHVCNDFVE